MSNDKPKTALVHLMDSVRKPEDLGCEVETTTTEKTVVEETKSTAQQPVTSEYITLQHIDPEICQPWDYADRPEDEMGDIESLAESIKTHGQQEPVLLRQSLAMRGKIQYEVIFGNRRWRACRHAGVKLLAIVKPMSDQQAALYQKEENENRKDLSDLARARSYKIQLDSGVFRSEKELSEVLGISKQNLNDILAFNRLPTELTDRLPNLKNLSRKLVVKMSVMSKEKKKLKCIIKLADKINTKKITSSNIEKKITKMMGSSEISISAEVKTVKEPNGKVLFTITQTPKGETIIKISPRLKDSYECSDVESVMQEYLTGRVG